MIFFIGALIFFIIMISVIAFTIFLYIRLVIAVKNNSDIPKWMYKIGHSIRGRGSDIYEDFIDKSVLNEVNFYIIGVIIASVVVYFLLFDKYNTVNAIGFWISAEFLIIILMRPVIILGRLMLSFIIPKIKKSNYSLRFSAAANAVKGMLFMSMFACFLALTLAGLPVKAPVVQVGEDKIIVGYTSANDLLLKGYTFLGKQATDIIVNKRDSHFYYGEMVELIKDGKGYGYVNLTPKYKDKAVLEECIITYYGISSKSKMFDDIKIADKNISTLSINYLKKDSMKDIFSLSPISYQESKGNERFSFRMQTYPYMLWKRYTIAITFFNDYTSNQFEVYAQHTLWE